MSQLNQDLAKKRLRIALAFPMGIAHLERIAYGIRRYCREQGKDWVLVSNPEKHHLEIADLQATSVDGIIGMLRTEQDLEFLRHLDLPVINISGSLATSPCPRVCPDFFAIGKAGAKHFLQKGHQNFAYYGLQDIWYSQEIFRGFFATLLEHDLPCESFQEKQVSFAAGIDENFLNWLQALPKPVALMAAHDPRATLVLQACLDLGIRVPEDLSIIGANNDNLICELAEPSLTSIERDSENIGYCAAENLDKLLLGESCEDRYFSKLKVVERESTAGVVTQHELLAKAVAYIEKNLQVVNVEATCQCLRRSRRWLEYAFRQEFKQSPKGFIDEKRLQAARKSLRDCPDKTLSEVAAMSGFNSPEAMNRLFLRKMGMGARAFRASTSF